MSNTLRAAQVSETQPAKIITLFGAGAAVCTALVTALATIDGVPPAVVASIGALAAVLTALVGYLTKQSVTAQTTPWEDVAAKVTPAGKVISGPADNARPTGALVALVDASPSSSFQPGTSVYPDEGDPL